MWPFQKNKTQKLEKKSHVVTLGDDLSSFLGAAYVGASPRSALDIYSNSSAVFIPVDLISETFSSLKPVIQIGDEILEDHPALDRIKQPSPFFTKKLLLKALAVDKLVTGECFPVAVGNVNRPPLELVPMSPCSVTSMESTDGAPISHMIYGQTLPGNYTRVNDGRRVRFIDGNLKEIAHIRGYSSRNNSMMRAESPLIAAAKEAKQHILGNLHNANMLEKGGRVSLVFHFKEDMDEDTFEEAKNRVRAQYGGVQSEEIGVTAGEEMEIKTLGTSNVDMDFGNLQTMAKHACFLTYRVPLALLTTDASTFDNYKQAMISLYDLATLPLADSIFEGLSCLLLPRYGIDPLKAKITYDKKSITALTVRTLEELQQRVNLNLETDNELRPMLGRGDIGTNGDVIRKPANLIPIDSDLFTTDASLNSE